MRNPISQMHRCWRWWRRLQPEGFFSWSDATQQINRVILPARFAYKTAGEKLRQLTKITPLDDATHRVELIHHDLLFYWSGPINNNLYFLIEQEFEPANPHCYTTDPIQLNSQSLVIDVGACEGLFAYRLLKSNQCRQVICFEPLKSMATLIERGAVENKVDDHLSVEPLAVSNLSGPVKLMATDNPDACHIEPCSPEDPAADAQAVRLDEYFESNQIKLTPQDLIKVDAEGTDFSVIEGAADSIARYHPQIAITTYHHDDHVRAISEKLRALHSGYQFRLKGFAHWTTQPRPVLLQASTLPPVHGHGKG